MWRRVRRAQRVAKYARTVLRTRRLDASPAVLYSEYVFGTARRALRARLVNLLLPVRHTHVYLVSTPSSDGCAFNS